MYRFIICLLFGYFLGSLSPAALLSVLKRKNLREHGTGNLGATNTMLVFGRKYGVMVMLFDMAKAFFIVRVTRLAFPALPAAALMAGSAAVVGHMFPFYLKFKGGKGLAAFGGMVLAFDARSFGILLIFGILMMILFNCTVALPVSAAIVFPLLTLLHFGSLVCTWLAALTGLLLITVHIGNIRKAMEGRDLHVREYLAERLFR